MKLIITLVLLLCTTFLCSQNSYDVSEEFPYGQAHPEAPKQIKDFQPMIGECICKSVRRNPDQTWGDPTDMVWKFKYIMNGKAVQDETILADGNQNGNIRQFIADSSRWYVHYYSTRLPSTVLPTWEGNKKEDGRIILYRDQKAPNGMDGKYRITFYDISISGFKWSGDWISKDETIVYPTWKIECTRKEN